MENTEDRLSGGDHDPNMDENSHISPPSLERSDSDADILCSCCFQLMIRPTTLTCGHNICRLCLAQWHKTSKQNTCPTCRQQWLGYPKVNIALRNMIQKLYPTQVEEREKELEADENARKLLTDFEKVMGQSNNGSPPTRNRAAFLSGMVWTLGLVLVAYWVWNWRHSDDNLLIHKPVVRWRASDVHRWLTDLEWGEQYAQLALDHHVDGAVLLAMDEDSIREVFHPADALHERAFLIALKDLRARGVKMPSTLWEFKALWPGMTLALTYGMKDFPRTVMLYMYFSHYDEIFVPFVHFSTPAVDRPNITFSWSDVPPPSLQQYVMFLTNMGLVPYWTIACFTWAFFGVHFWTSTFVMATCLVMTFFEALALKTLYTLGPRSFFIKMAKQQVKLLCSFLVFAILWPLVPKIVCDFLFYVALYFSPFQLLNSLLIQIRQY